MDQEMRKEKAIKELVTKSKEMEAIDAAIRALGDWTELEHLKKELQKEMGRMEQEVDQLIDKVNGGELDIEKALGFREDENGD